VKNKPENDEARRSGIAQSMKRQADKIIIANIVERRKQDNSAIIDRIKGVPAQPATEESDNDPQNPNR